MKTELARGKLLQPTAENRLLVLRCEFTLHTLMHTFHFETKPPNSVLSSRRGKCELRDVMHTFAVIEISLHYSSLVKIALSYSTIESLPKKSFSPLTLIDS